MVRPLAARARSKCAACRRSSKPAQPGAYYDPPSLDGDDARHLLHQPAQPRGDDAHRSADAGLPRSRARPPLPDRAGARDRRRAAAAPAHVASTPTAKAGGSTRKNSPTSKASTKAIRSAASAICAGSSGARRGSWSTPASTPRIGRRQQAIDYLTPDHRRCARRDRHRSRPLHRLARPSLRLRTGPARNRAPARRGAQRTRPRLRSARLPRRRAAERRSAALRVLDNWCAIGFPNSAASPNANAVGAKRNATLSHTSRERETRRVYAKYRRRVAASARSTRRSNTSRVRAVREGRPCWQTCATRKPWLVRSNPRRLRGAIDRHQTLTIADDRRAVDTRRPPPPPSPPPSPRRRSNRALARDAHRARRALSVGTRRALRANRAAADAGRYRSRKLRRRRHQSDPRRRGTIRFRPSRSTSTPRPIPTCAAS